MCRLVEIRRYEQARRARMNLPGRARPTGRSVRQGRGLVSIGVVSAELMRRLFLGR